ncbi:hypothetical protein ACLEJQ_10955 [Pseudomonas sp. SMV71]|uniref:hypothetical protein n=1 Tax=Pseudomonas sp. SMV71 TaxID=3390195 RepID=UPI003F854792
MADSDKKEQSASSNESGAGGPAPFVIQDPVVEPAPMPGLPLGLIRRSDLDNGLTTTIQTWGNEIPDGFKEYFRLQIARGTSNEWDLVQEHEVTGGASWVPLVFTIPSAFLLDPEHEGTFSLRYEHENLGGVFDRSGRAYIHIDKTPPGGTLPPDPMTFTFVPPITDDTFGTDDYLEATIPPWTGDQKDVLIAFGWIKGELPEDPADIDLIVQPIDPAVSRVIQIPKSKFIEAGDGRCCGGYVLIDKAGNPSPLSKYELISVALDPWPVPPLDEPTAADATGGELIRSDVVDGNVLVNVPYVDKGKNTDIVVVKWNTKEITPGTPLGSNPASGTNIPVPWSTIWEEYGSTTTGVVPTPLSYTVFRGVEPFPSDVATVRCNFSTTGPEDPDPEPGNDLLEPVTVVGLSGVDNVLVPSDEDQDIFAYIKLVAPLVDDDTYQVLWNGTPIGSPYVIDVNNDSAGDVIEIPLDWDTIRLEGPSAAMPVWYKLTNASHVNPGEPKERTPVQIDFLVSQLPPAIPQHVHPTNGLVNCDSLRWNAAGTSYGIEYLIPPSPYLKAGDDVAVQWNGYTNFANPVLVPGANKTHTFTNITEEQATNGIIWLIEPYATHLLPVWQSNSQIGKGEVSYTIPGKPVVATPTADRIVLSQGEGTCNVPTRPTP